MRTLQEKRRVPVQSEFVPDFELTPVENLSDDCQECFDEDFKGFVVICREGSGGYPDFTWEPVAIFANEPDAIRFARQLAAGDPNLEGRSEGSDYCSYWVGCFDGCWRRGTLRMKVDYESDEDATPDRVLKFWSRP